MKIFTSEGSSLLFLQYATRVCLWSTHRIMHQTVLRGPEIVLSVHLFTCHVGPCELIAISFARFTDAHVCSKRLEA